MRTSKNALEKQKRESDDAKRAIEKKLEETKQSYVAEIESLKRQFEKEKEIPEKREEVKKVPIVEEAEAQNIARQLRMNLIAMNIEYQNIQSVLFENLVEEDKINVSDLAQLFMKTDKGGSLKESEAILLARFLIEPRLENTIEYNGGNEDSFGLIFDGLLELVNEYVPVSDTSIRKEMFRVIFEKISPKFSEFEKELRAAQSKEGVIDEPTLYSINNKLGLDFGQEEMDFLVLQMYNQSKRLDSLYYKKVLEELKSKKKEQEELAKKKKKEDKKSPAIEPLPEPKKKSPEKKQQAKTNSGKKAKAQKGIEVTEDEMIEIAQKCFTAIAEKNDQSTNYYSQFV
eukprot:TRINITY_DN2992_c0_g1_i2.p1 TRINITY_DN2992_c0_g1~~TRINITY_DN2992_c0_g1_i2.p1  ORF type:complete len:343 (-),score=96.83 TRINITY_DN2992_c0_g1_i2:196-1224(-)